MQRIDVAPMISWQIVDLRPDAEALVDHAARLLFEVFLNRTGDWQDLDSARREVVESLAPERISRVVVNDTGTVLGWIGGMPDYGGRVWEIHPLVVGTSYRRKGVGRALVNDLERLVAGRGGLTLWAGADDENDETTLSGRDLYQDISGAIRSIRNLRNHPYEFYLRVGFTIAGVLPDANGRGKPDIFLAKRVEGNSR
jgi:aminoglycoside 6'-N-acetyltransferase I